MRQLAAILSVSDPLIANWLTEIFSEFLSKGRLFYLLTIRLKREIVRTGEIVTELDKNFLFLVGCSGPIS